MIAPLIGAILGELFAGIGSDYLVNWRTKRTGVRVPEYRLSLVYPGFLLSIVGLIGENLPHSSYYSCYWVILNFPL
jgi:hypothetical protein